MRIGILADIQYSDEEKYKKREYRDSLDKLSEAVDDLNQQDLDFVVQLGDLINQDFDSFNPVLNILEKLKHPIYHVLGNHDYIVDDHLKFEIPNLLKMPSRYYSFSKNDWRFVFLDGNDLSLNSHPENSKHYQESKNYFDSLDGISEWWNGALSKEQMIWLQRELEIAHSRNEKVGIFCHFSIIPESRFILWNSDEVSNLIGKFENVKFWMNGHHHEGAYQQIDDKHFLTLKGMVECESNAYAVMEVLSDQLKVLGKGEETTRVLKL